MIKMEEGEKINIPEVAETELAGSPEKERKRFEVVDAKPNKYGATKCLEILEKPIPSEREIILAAGGDINTIVPASFETGNEVMYVVKFPGEEQEILSYAGLVAAVDMIKGQEKDDSEDTG